MIISGNALWKKEIETMFFCSSIKVEISGNNALTRKKLHDNEQFIPEIWFQL